MRDNAAGYQDFFAGNEFEQYLEQMELPKCWGDELTIQAAADVFCIKIHLLTSTKDNWYVDYEPMDASATVVRECFISYMSPVHYNTMVPAERQVEEVCSQPIQHAGSPQPEQKEVQFANDADVQSRWKKAGKKVEMVNSLRNNPEGDVEEREVEDCSKQDTQHSAPPEAAPAGPDDDTEERDLEVSSKQDTQHSAPPPPAAPAFVETASFSQMQINQARAAIRRF
jgi:hypothetical protein